MSDNLKGVAFVILLLIILMFASRTRAQECGLQVSSPCFIIDTRESLYGEERRELPPNNLNICHNRHCSEEVVALIAPMIGIYTGQGLVIYPIASGSEFYCVDAEGNGTLGLSINNGTKSGTAFPCGTFYILDTGEYQISTVDGLVIVADNFQFVGAYYVDSGN